MKALNKSINFLCLSRCFSYFIIKLALKYVYWIVRIDDNVFILYLPQIFLIINKYNFDKIVLRYKKEYFIPIDIAGGKNCLNRSIIKMKLFHTVIILCFVPKWYLRLSIFKNRSSAEAWILFDYYFNHQSHCGITIYDYVKFLMGKYGNWASKFDMLCVSMIYND